MARVDLLTTRGQDRVDQRQTQLKIEPPPPESIAPPRIVWPRKYPLFGVDLSATSVEQTVELLCEAAKQGEAAIASFLAAHAVVTAAGDRSLRDKISGFAIAAPDGQPVRFALNRIHRAGLRDRVYGPEVMMKLCTRAAETGLPIYLYGGSDEEMLLALRRNLVAKLPRLIIAGAEAPPFRALTPAEDETVVRRINASGARIVFIGLGCPKQDLFAAAHARNISAVQVCVGAAFDLHAGRIPMAPAWMQRVGLEWLFRLFQEPRRLAPRYVVTNPIFIARFGAEWLVSRVRRRA
jgi:exopolysaccharide biosynthesis WecB/TagA/CpsF family protein